MKNNIVSVIFYLAIVPIVWNCIVFPLKELIRIYHANISLIKNIGTRQKTAYLL